MMDNAVRTALSHGWVESGDRVVLTAGLPIGQPGTTNLMRVITIGEILLRGQGIGITQAATGPVVVVRRHGEASADTVRGKILVAPATDEDWLPLMQEAAALVVETGGLTSHAAIVGLTLGKPVVVGADRATELLSPGLVVTVDGAHGLVYRGVVQV
jgi:pyruvate kinase